MGATPRFLSSSGLVAVLLCCLALGCGLSAKPEFTAERPVALELEAARNGMLDLRFRHAELRIRQTEGTQISIEGVIRVRTTDAEAARLRAEAVELSVHRGRFTRLELPDPGEGFAYSAILTVSLPRRLNLNAVLGSGEIRAEMELPLKTDLQVGSGVIRLLLPPSSSAFVSAQCNLGPVEVEGFDQVRGESLQQFASQLFNGEIGTPVKIVGNQVEARVNEGSIAILGQRPGEPTPW